MKFKAVERAWVKKLLGRLTPAERIEYEKRCMAAPRHPHSGKLYDGDKAEIAEQVMYDSRVPRRPAQGETPGG